MKIMFTIWCNPICEIKKIIKNYFLNFCYTQVVVLYNTFSFEYVFLVLKITILNIQP